MRTATGAAVLAVTALLGAGIASADVPVDKTLTWKGDFPVIGTLSPISTQMLASLPSPVTVGQPGGTVPVTLNVDAPADATNGLELVGAASVEGTVKATVVVTDSAGTTVNVPILLTIPKTATPASGEHLKFTATGNASFPSPQHAGTATVVLDGASASTTLEPKDSSGNDTALGTFTVNLSLDPAGQDTSLGTVQING
ncbi:hypothetical protein BC739_002125 [Kutzneria viridogrisea]|nr:DUF6801 domain-containing protein [Kutzneria albida]MBA8924926.1 hypothetical protein [Kutzneria viridogrisea]